MLLSHPLKVQDSSSSLDRATNTMFKNGSVAKLEERNRLKICGVINLVRVRIPPESQRLYNTVIYLYKYKNNMLPWTNGKVPGFRNQNRMVRVRVSPGVPERNLVVRIPSGRFNRSVV